MPVVIVLRSICDRFITNAHSGQTCTLSQCFLPFDFEDSEFKFGFPNSNDFCGCIRNRLSDEGRPSTGLPSFVYWSLKRITKS